MQANHVVVAARSRRDIERLALQMRRLFGFEDHERVEMLPVIELILPQVIDDFVYEVVDDRALGDAEATTSMTERTMKISETCYHGARRGQTRYAFTLAHELGHLLMHTASPTSLARGIPKAYLNPEWQADAFAGAFLVPADEARRCRSIEEMAIRFGISGRAAEVRAKILKIERLIGATKKKRRPN